MSLFYGIAHRIGFTPWERAATHRPAAEQIAALFDREGRGREPPYGRALDLGCGSGFWSLELARRGWQVTGIDLVAKAVRKARERVRQAGGGVHFVEGDVTALRAAGVGSDFHLFWDFGTLHGLSPAQLRAAGREVSAVAAPEATLLTVAWAPGARVPLPRGVDRGEIEAAFPDWKIIDDEAFDATGLPRPLRSVRPHCYRLRRV